MLTVTFQNVSYNDTVINVSPFKAEKLSHSTLLTNSMQPGTYKCTTLVG